MCNTMCVSFCRFLWMFSCFGSNGLGGDVTIWALIHTNSLSVRQTNQHNGGEGKRGKKEGNCEFDTLNGGTHQHVALQSLGVFIQFLNAYGFATMVLPPPLLSSVCPSSPQPAFTIIAPFCLLFHLVSTFFLSPSTFLILSF